MMTLLRIIVGAVLVILIATIAFGIELTPEEKALIAEMAGQGEEEVRDTLANPEEEPQPKAPPQPQTMHISELPRVTDEGRPVSSLIPNTNIVPLVQETPQALPAQAVQVSRTTTAPAPSSDVRQELMDFFLYGNVQQENITPENVGLQGRGLLMEENGGFSPDLWQGALPEKAMEALKIYAIHTPESAVGRRLLQRLLLTQAFPPGDGEEGVQASHWLRLRSQVLLNMGLASAVAEIMQDVPEQALAKDELLAQAWVESRLLVGDENACGTVRQQVQQKQTAFWHQALLVCQVLGANAEALRLGLELMPEAVKQDDPMLHQMAQAIYDGGQTASPRLKPEQKLRPLQSVLYGFATKLMTPDVMVRLPDALLRRLAKNEALDISFRLQAAEKVVDQQGAIDDISLLTSLYDQLVFENTQQLESDALAAAKAEPDGSVARAILWQAAGAAHLPVPQKMSVLQALWQRAEADALPHLGVALTPDRRGVTPDRVFGLKGGEAFAQDVVRRALRSGHVNLARPWWERLKVRGVQDSLAADRSELALAFGVLDGTLEMTDFLRWWVTREKNSKNAEQVFPKTLSVAEAIGLAVPEVLWDEMEKRYTDAYLPLTNSSGVLWQRAVKNGTDQARLGTSVLTLLAPLAYVHSSELSPETLNLVLRGLRTLGLAEDAQALALEALLQAAPVRF